MPGEKPLSRQNKPFPLLYLGHAQIIIEKMIRLKILLKLSKKASHPFFYTAHNVLLTPPPPHYLGVAQIE